jgi:thioredoxin-like negative regulator of GroEL
MPPICSVCGQENPEGARFCNNSAAPLGADAAAAYGTGAFEEAAEIYADIGALPDEAHARLRAAEALVAAGRRAEADAQLQQALAFYRSVGATGYIREAEGLFAASA